MKNKNFIEKANRVVAGFTAALLGLTLFSGCNSTAAPLEETAVPTTTEQTLSADELDALTQNMPEIVFVMSHQQDDENIMGCYVLNTGQIKLFDYRSIAQGEIYDVRDIYDRIEEANCERLEPRIAMGYEERLITEDKLNHLSQDEMVEYYKRLLQIEGDAEYIKWGWTIDSYGGDNKLYGIKGNAQGERECILLRGYGTDSEYLHSNPDARDIYTEFIKFMPDLNQNASS